MEEVRRRTVALVAGLDQPTLDWEGDDGRDNAIGSLLYHIPLVEVSWLFLDILEQALPGHVQADFPHAMADDSGRLSRVLSVPLRDHLARLERSRATFLDTMRGMPIDDWRRPRSPGDVDYCVTPEWAVFHLIEHEAGHAFQISALKARLARAGAGRDPA